MKKPVAPGSPSRILVIGPAWIGDMVMSQSLFITLKNTEPDCHIEVLAPAWSLSLLAKMPQVAKAIAMPLTHGQFNLIDRIRLGKQLRSENYNKAIVLPNSWKSALIPFFADIPVRTGYIGECRWGLLNDVRKLDKLLLTMTVQRFVALGLPKNADLPPEFPIPALVISQDRQQVVTDKFRLKPAPRILALCPGAEFGPAKRWPTQHYAEIARKKIGQGWQVWLFGSGKDKDLAEQINNQTSGRCNDLTGQTSLAEAIDLMSLVDAVVANDSGLMHVAAALDKKIIAIYGSSDPGFTPPLNVKAQVISLNLACAPCFKRECPLYPTGHKENTKCLTGIKPDRILDLIDG